MFDRTKSWKRRVLTGEKLTGIGIRLEASPNKSLLLLALQWGLSKSTAHVRPYKTTVVRSFLPPDYEAWIRYCRWFQESVINGLIDPELVFYSEEAWFNLSSYVNSQNNRHWGTENPHAVHEVLLHNLNVGAINTRRIIGIRRFHYTINSGRYILPPFFDKLTDEHKSYGRFIRSVEAVHTANNSMDALHEVFSQWDESRRLRSPY
jgi:hypothetical protein